MQQQINIHPEIPMEVISFKADLLKEKAQILALFSECYGKELSGDIWDWAYIGNIFGNPIVTILRDAGKIVAHYAVIPFFLQNGLGETIKSYLSMTTMVAPSHRKGGLFIKLADATYRRMVEDGGEMVLGFPNSQSSPGFKKYLQWSMDRMDYVACAAAEDICADDIFRDYLSDKSRFALNLADPAIKAWRMANPGGKYHDLGGCIVKEFGGTYDLIWLHGADGLSSLPRDKKINFLVDAANQTHINNKSFDYQFGYRGFSPAVERLSVCKTLSLSDVF